MGRLVSLPSRQNKNVIKSNAVNVFIGSSMTKTKSFRVSDITTMQRKELLKKSAIRYAEYYGMVRMLVTHYMRMSASEKIFTNLISIIGSDANIKMAYRNLKSNKGSSTLLVSAVRPLAT